MPRVLDYFFAHTTARSQLPEIRIFSVRKYQLSLTGVFSSAHNSASAIRPIITTQTVQTRRRSFSVTNTNIWSDTRLELVIKMFIIVIRLVGTTLSMVRIVPVYSYTCVFTRSNFRENARSPTTIPSLAVFESRAPSEEETRGTVPPLALSPYMSKKNVYC